MRFLVGAALLAGCALWIHQNHLLSGVTDAAAKALENQSVADVDANQLTVDSRGTKPLSLPLMPTFLTVWFNSFNPGIAGLILVASSLFRGVKMSFFVLPAAAVLLFGPALGLPGIGTWVPAEYTSLALGLALALLGLLFGRSYATDK